MVLQTTDMLTFVSFIGYIPHSHSNKTCHIMFTMHVGDLTFGGGGDGSGVSGKKAAKPATRAQDCISTFV